MRIERITVHHCALPLVRPFRTSFFTEYVKEVLLLEIETDLGVGWGECVAAPDPLYSHEFNDAVMLVWREHLVPRLIGRDLAAEEVPELLGPVRGHPMAHGYVAEGYRRVKLKIQPGWDIEPTRVIRERYPDIPLQVDANQAYSRADIEHLCALDEFDLLLIEQPIHEEDYLGHKLLAKRMRTPVCLDESVLSADNAESLIDYGACEIVNIKAGRVGGYLSAKAIHDVAVARGVPVWCGGMVETGIGRAANIALASLPGFTLPGDTSSSSRFFSLDVTEPFVMDPDGMMTVPTGPGLGVTPVPDVLAELTTSREELVT